MTAIVVIDTETTGLGPKSREGPRPDAIVQVGVAWRHPKKGIQVWERLCNPGLKFLANGRASEALAVNRLSEASVRKAPSAATIARDLRALLGLIKEEAGGLDVRAFNVEFDRPFLEAEPWNLLVSWGPCLMIEAAQAFGGLSGRIPLWRACQEAGVPTDDRLHTAGTDARLALQVHEFIARSAPTRRVAPVHSRYNPGCELDHPHDGPCGYFAEGDFYEFE